MHIKMASSEWSVCLCVELVTTRPASDDSKLGASAVYQSLDRSRIKNDTISLQLAMIEWGILNTDIGLLAAGYSTRAMKQRYDM